MASSRHDSGQALVIVAFVMVTMLGFLGLVVDLGYVRYMKRHMQKLADAAALAAALELSACGSTPDCSALTTTAQNAVTENSFTGGTLVKQVEFLLALQWADRHCKQRAALPRLEYR